MIQSLSQPFVSSKRFRKQKFAFGLYCTCIIHESSDLGCVQGAWNREIDRYRERERGEREWGTGQPRTHSKYMWRYNWRYWERENKMMNQWTFYDFEGSIWFMRFKTFLSSASWTKLVKNYTYFCCYFKMTNGHNLTYLYLSYLFIYTYIYIYIYILFFVLFSFSLYCTLRCLKQK